jgi:hypothetical protein
LPAAVSFPLSGAGCLGLKPRAERIEMMMTVIQKNWQELIRPEKLQVATGMTPSASPRWWPSRSSAGSV